MSLELNDLRVVRFIRGRTLHCRIQSLEERSPDLLKIGLRLKPNSGFGFHAGQYVEVIDYGRLRRSPSSASALKTSGYIELPKRQVPDGAMSEDWFGQAEVNDLLKPNRPLGIIFLREIGGHDLVFLPTGAGIAEFEGMLEAMAGMAHEEQLRTVAIYWGARIPSDTYWDATALDVEHRFVLVMSQAEADWTGVMGYMEQADLYENANFQQAMNYACGSAARIYSAHEQLCATGLPAKICRSDSFAEAASA